MLFIIRKRKIKDLFPLIKIVKEFFPLWAKHVPFFIFPTLVMEKNSKVVGFIVLKNEEIALIAIDKNHRSKNNGSELLKAAFNYLKSKNKKYCTSKIRTDNPRALKFYKNNGFRVERIKKRPILGDVYLVEKKLL